MSEGLKSILVGYGVILAIISAMVLLYLIHPQALIVGFFAIVFTAIAFLVGDMIRDDFRRRNK